ncbi:MAG TPA: hypothetical protein VN253_07530 [Kofleriaceae bacterium]|nr:hypothetical protein [Kofleriaceae bacterium]
MAVTPKWDQVENGLAELDQFRVLHPTLAALRGLIATLRVDSRFAEVEPGLSLATLTLRLRDRSRYLAVAWNEDPPSFMVSFVDPPLEFSERRAVPPANVVAALVDYLDHIRS